MEEMNGAKGGRHQTTQKFEKGMSGLDEHVSAIHPTLTATLNGQKVRIMIDTGASSSYICTEMITRLGLKPIRKEKRNIEQMYGTVNRVVELYNINIKSDVLDFGINLNCINSEKTEVTTVPNPQIEQLKMDHPRLRRLHFGDEKAHEEMLPVHIILES